MQLRLHDSLPEAQLDSILALCGELGYTTRFPGGRRDILELNGGNGRADHSLFEAQTGVLEVLEGHEIPALHQRAPAGEDTIVSAGEAVFGGGAVSLIAGPCAVEDYDRLLQIARAVRAAGATLMRGGAYKPRTSPYAFQGLGREGLEVLGRVREEVGIGVVTEVLDPRDVEAVGEVADIYQVGARSMANFALLKELGQVRRPVLLKRGFAATIQELLMAAEYILAGGNTQVILCERGIRSFDTFSRNILDVGAVAYLKQVTHLPVIVDPSHAAGRADLVVPLARAGLVAGADGLIVEVHPSPEEAQSDGEQAISLAAFEDLAQDAATLAELDGRRLVKATSASAEGLPGDSLASELSPNGLRLSPDSRASRAEA